MYRNENCLVIRSNILCLHMIFPFHERTSNNQADFMDTFHPFSWKDAEFAPLQAVPSLRIQGKSAPGEAGGKEGQKILLTLDILLWGFP